MTDDDLELSIKPHPCKCGGKAEVYTLYPVAKQKYQGLVECPNCCNYVRGITWAWTRYDAVEEWNKVMPEQEEEGAEDD